MDITRTLEEIDAFLAQKQAELDEAQAEPPAPEPAPEPEKPEKKRRKSRSL